MRQRLLLVVLLVGVLATITSLAYSDLPDQTWIRGIYDGGDEDDAILQIQTNLSASQLGTFHVATAPAPCVDLLIVQYETFAPFWVSSLDPARGPPTSS
jgi:hypothetical protein